MDAHPKRRIFVNKGDDRYQLFSFSQHDDGTIYCGAADFVDAKWIGFDITAQGPKLATTESIGDGKLSLHGTGMAAIRRHDDPSGHQLIVKGNLLKNDQELRARHLFTVFLKEPGYLPHASPAFNRKSDYSMQANEDLRPLVLAFFAVPRVATEIDFRFSLQVEQMTSIPNDLLGMHYFTLRYHHVMWFAYRTKHMDKWPKYSHYCYSDGYWFPVFIGTGEGAFTLEFRQPRYLLDGTKLVIDCGEALPRDAIGV